MINWHLPALLLSSPLFMGLLSTVLFGKKSRTSSIPGLLFHSVLPNPGKEMSHYSLSRFSEAITALDAEGYKGISVKDASSPSNGKVDRPFFMTFDDGMASVYRYALPVLKSINFNATVFCLGNYFGKSSTWDIYSGNSHCSIKEIKDIAALGFEIGSHTLSHPCLPYLDKSSIIRELADSKKILEDISGTSVTSLSFPYGSWNRQIWELAKSLGYKAATLYRGVPYGQEPLYSVYGVYKFDTPEDVVSKLSASPCFSTQRARSKMMSHFARGTPLWKYRNSYIKV